MQSDILSPQWGWENFRQDVFQLVAWGYDMEEYRIRRCSQETDITGLIRAGIRAKLNEELPPRSTLYSAMNEDPVDDDAALGKRRRRIDILIESAHNLPRMYYSLEAKRCARRTHPIRWYTNGVECFVNRTYARDSPEAGLLGLFQTDDEAYWFGQLSNGTQAPGLSCQSPLSRLDLECGLVGAAISRHQRTDGTSIVLTHAFLDCKP